jgi:hypothetical protein
LQCFPEWFRDGRHKKKEGVKDPSIIEFCHKKRWLLVTTDHEMRQTHVEEIKGNACFTALATAHNSSSPEEHIEWVKAVIKLKPEIHRRFKKMQRPWFATFSREGNITSFKTFTASDTTRRTRPK